MLDIMPVATKIPFTAMLMVDTINASFHAADLPFNSLKASTKEKIPIAINIHPGARMPAPSKEGETWERSVSSDVKFCCCCSGIHCSTCGIIVPANAKGGPIMSIIMPIII